MIRDHAAGVNARSPSPPSPSSSAEAVDALCSEIDRVSDAVWTAGTLGDDAEVARLLAARDGIYVRLETAESAARRT